MQLKPPDFSIMSKDCNITGKNSQFKIRVNNLSGYLSIHIPLMYEEHLRWLEKSKDWKWKVKSKEKDSRESAWGRNESNLLW